MGNTIWEKTKHLDLSRCCCKKKTKIVEFKNLTSNEIEDLIEITGLEKEEIETWFASFIVHH
jgi:hypothetical protein